MRCSQCGYHSFDGLENCKKCGEFLTKRGNLFANDQGESAPKSQPLLPLDEFQPSSPQKVQQDHASPELGKERIFPTFLQARDHDGNFITDIGNNSRCPILFEAHVDDVDGVSSLLWRRIFATLCDLLILTVVWGGFVAVGAWGLEQPLVVFVQALSENLSLRISYYLIFIGSLLSYFTLLHCSGQTLGKMLLGISVINCNGQPLSFAEGVFRSAGGLLSLLCGGWGYFSVLFDDEHRGWNDRIAGTHVVLNDDNVAIDIDGSAEKSNGEEVSR